MNTMDWRQQKKMRFENEKMRIKALLGDSNYKKVNKFLDKARKKELENAEIEKELLKIVKKSPGDIEYCRQLDAVLFQEMFMMG